MRNEAFRKKNKQYIPLLIGLVTISRRTAKSSTLKSSSPVSYSSPDKLKAGRGAVWKEGVEEGVEKGVGEGESTGIQGEGIGRLQRDKW